MKTLLQPAIFLDRDGVINVDTGYPHLPEHLEFTPTAVKAIAHINRAGYLAIVATNQSGIARGYFTLDQVEAFHRHMAHRLAAECARIDAFYIAPWHAEGSVSEYAIAHEDRKPGAGMLLRAIREWGIAREHSVMIGDKPSDAEAAKRAGLASIIVPSDTCDLAATVADWFATRGVAT